MELITILNQCHRFQGFVYEHARFSSDKKIIEVWVRPCKGSAAICSRCHQTTPGYDKLAERRFEFIPLWGFFVFLRAAAAVQSLWRRYRGATANAR
jgi:transposase